MTKIIVTYLKVLGKRYISGAVHFTIYFPKRVVFLVEGVSGETYLNMRSTCAFEQVPGYKLAPLPRG